MDIISSWMSILAGGLLSFFISPFTYILLLLIVLLCKKQIELERNLFSARLHTLTEGVLYALFYGLLAGGVISLLILGVGIVLTVETYIGLWLLALLLSMVHIRYFCFAYAGAILGTLSLLANWLPQGGDVVGLAWMWSYLTHINVTALLATVAVLHLAEALLVYLSASKRTRPVYIQSKRGRLVGAYKMEFMWFVPVFFIMERGEHSLFPFYAGWPLFGLDWVALSFLFLPVMLSYHGQAVTSSPKQKATGDALGLALYAILLLGLSLAARWLPYLLLVSLLFAWFGHEAVRWYSKWRNTRQSAIFVNPGRGLKIMAIPPNTPAERMGLQPGEVIHKVNGQVINQKKDLYQQLTQNLAFCKLEVFNLDGEIKFAQSSVYEHDHHELGVIVAPDEDVLVVKERKLHFFSLLFERRRKRTLLEDQQQSIGG